MSTHSICSDNNATTSDTSINNTTSQFHFEYNTNILPVSTMMRNNINTFAQPLRISSNSSSSSTRRSSDSSHSSTSDTILNPTPLYYESSDSSVSSSRSTYAQSSSSSSSSSSSYSDVTNPPPPPPPTSFTSSRSYYSRPFSFQYHHSPRADSPHPFSPSNHDPIDLSSSSLDSLSNDWVIHYPDDVSSSDSLTLVIEPHPATATATATAISNTTSARNSPLRSRMSPNRMNRPWRSSSPTSSGRPSNLNDNTNTNYQIETNHPNDNHDEDDNDNNNDNETSIQRNQPSSSQRSYYSTYPTQYTFQTNPTRSTNNRSTNNNNNDTIFRNSSSSLSSSNSTNFQAHSYPPNNHTQTNAPTSFNPYRDDSFRRYRVRFPSFDTDDSGDRHFLPRTDLARNRNTNNNRNVSQQIPTSTNHSNLTNYTTYRDHDIITISSSSSSDDDDDDDNVYNEQLRTYYHMRGTQSFSEGVSNLYGNQHNNFHSNPTTTNSLTSFFASNTATTTTFQPIHHHNSTTMSTFTSPTSRFPRRPPRRSLQTFVLRDRSMLQDNQTDCCICLEEMQFGERITKLDCHHFFHDTCLERWLRVKAVCPYCKSDVN